MFDVGDRIRVEDGSKTPDYVCDWIPYMNKFVGKTFTVCSIINFAKGRVGYCFEELQDTEDSDYIFDSRCVMEVDSRCVTEVDELTQERVFDYLTHAADLPVWAHDYPGLFRAVTVLEGRTVHGYVIEVYGKPMIVTTTGKFVEVDSSSISLYTGYCDMYGHPIYEGDLVCLAQDTDKCYTDMYIAKVVYTRNQDFNGFALKTVITVPHRLVSVDWSDLVLWDSDEPDHRSNFYHPSAK